MHTNRPRSIRRRERASVLIVVVTVLALVLVLAVAYLQTARGDRIAARGVDLPDIYNIISATVAQVESELLTDLFGESGDLFDEVNDKVEPYDYAWTSNSVSVTLNNQFGSPFGDDSVGGELDDRWLASSAPFDDSGTPRWGHLTNLNGIWIFLPTASGAVGELAVDNSTDPDQNDEFVSIAELRAPPTSVDPDLAVNTYQNVGADADGDGIEDSIWTWAPIRRVGDIEYYVAVRVIDNSSMINAAVATSQIDGAGAFDTTAGGDNAPRWYSPSSLDLGGFVFDTLSYTNPPVAGVPTSPTILDIMNGDLRDGWLDWRDSPTPPSGAAATLPIAWIDREDHWLKGPSLYRNFHPDYADYNPISVATESELRFRNGLDDATRTRPIESVADGMSRFLRDGTGGTAYDDVPNISPGNFLEYFEREPRHQMTVLSGASVYRPRLVNESSTRVLRRNINMATADLRDVIQSVLDAGSPAYPTGRTFNSTRHYANQIAASLTDYVDADMELTVLDAGTADEAVGMENLPILTAVYVQGRYEVLGTPTPDDSDGNGVWDASLELKGDIGYAIEIRNPTRTPINLTSGAVGIELFIDGQSVGDLGTIYGLDIAPNDAAILYKVSGSGQPGYVAANDDISNHVPANDTTHPFTPPPAAAPTQDVSAFPNTVWPTGDPTATDIRVELVITSGASNVSYSTLLSEPLPQTYSSTSLVGEIGTSPAGKFCYWQHTTGRDGQGINMLTVTEGNAGTAEYKERVIPNQAGEPLLQTGPSGGTNLPTLNLADKSTVLSGGAGSMGTVVTTDQLVINGTGVLNHVGELMHLNLVSGPTTTQTVHALWNGLTTTNDHYIPYNTTALIDTGAARSNRLPHAAALLERFMFAPPFEDGADNDGDGSTDEADELLVPGTINLNTAPAHLLRKILPIPDATLRNNVVNAIVDYRDGTTRPGIANYRSNPGIAMIGELMLALDNANVTLADYAGDSGRIPTGADTVVDFVGQVGPDMIIDDREELATPYKWLANVASPRSDFYTVYLEVRGYRAGDFTAPVQQEHAFAILDRSRAIESSDQVWRRAIVILP